jgi:hypothetical protein
MHSDDDCHFEATLSSMFKSIEPRNVVQFIEHDWSTFNMIELSKYHWIYVAECVIGKIEYIIKEIQLVVV